MNFLDPDLHTEIIERLWTGQSIRKIAHDLRVAKGTVQVRKNLLLAKAGARLPDCRGGRIRAQPSKVHARRAARVRGYYAEIQEASHE